MTKLFPTGKLLKYRTFLYSKVRIGQFIDSIEYYVQLLQYFRYKSNVQSP